MWHPPAPQLKKIRERIAHDPEAWKKIISNRTLKARTGGISGNGLARPPRGFDADDPNIEDIKRKSFTAMTEGKVAEAKSEGFASEVGKSFKVAAPLIGFLAQAMEVDF